MLWKLEEKYPIPLAIIHLHFSQQLGRVVAYLVVVVFEVYFDQLSETVLYRELETKLVKEVKKLRIEQPLSNLQAIKIIELYVILLVLKSINPTDFSLADSTTSLDLIC